MTQKSLLQSAGDGTAVPAGYVGEYLESVLASNVISPVTINSYANTGLTLNLSSGVWLVGFSLAYVVTTSGGGNFRLANQSGALVGNCIEFLGSTQTTGVTRVGYYRTTQNEIINLQIRGTSASNITLISDSITASLADPDNKSFIWAVRIA